MINNILVTGASGHLGRRVIHHLLNSNKIHASRIIAGTRNPDALTELAAQGVAIRRVDFNNLSSLEEAFADVDKILIISTDEFDIVGGKRLKQHESAVAAAKKAGATHVAFTSMLGPEPGSPFLLASDYYGTEQAIKASGISYTIFSNNSYHENLLMSLPAIVAAAGLEELTSLLDKSLLKRVGEERYDLHELVRQYAASHLHSDPQEDSRTHELHSSYYAAQLEQWGEKIASPRQMETLAEMDAEIDNVRLAWSWIVARGQIANIQKSLRSLWRFHDIRGRFQDGVVLMRQAASVLQTLDETEGARDAERSTVLGRVLAHLGWFCGYLGRYEEAREVLQQSLTLLRASADRAALAYALAVLGYMKIRLGEFGEARQHAEESLALNRALGYHDEMVYCLVTLSYIYLAQEASETAYELSSEALTINRDFVGDPLATEHCLLSLSAAASYLRRFVAARQWAEESLQINKALGHRSGIGEALKWLGLISHQLGETERAQALLRQSVSQFREIGDPTFMADALVDLGVVSRAAGAEAEAKQYLLEALQTAIETQTNHTALQALMEIAVIEMREGNSELALELVTYCLQHPSTKREVTDQAESLRVELVAQLTPQQIEAAGARAHAKTLESLAQEILSAA